MPGYSPAKTRRKLREEGDEHKNNLVKHQIVTYNNKTSDSNLIETTTNIMIMRYKEQQIYSNIYRRNCRSNTMTSDMKRQ